MIREAADLMITLEVPFDRFADELKARMPLEPAYAAEHDGGILLTAAKPDLTLVLRCETRQNRGTVENTLQTKGVRVLTGSWLLGETPIMNQSDGTAYVAAVAYRSRDLKPGCWMDAYANEPSVQEVLTNMFEEFRTNGEVGNVTFEDFMRLANPNVVIFSPDEVRYHLGQKANGCP